MGPMVLRVSTTASPVVCSGPLLVRQFNSLYQMDSEEKDDDLILFFWGGGILIIFM